MLGDAILVRNNETGVVRDRLTGLVWQDNIDFANVLAPMSWNQAIGYCEALDLGGYDDWRMPNLNELYSIVDQDGES